MCIIESFKFRLLENAYGKCKLIIGINLQLFLNYYNFIYNHLMNKRTFLTLFDIYTSEEIFILEILKNLNRISIYFSISNMY
jgi:hypothetical protein